MPELERDHRRPAAIPDTTEAPRVQGFSLHGARGTRTPDLLGAIQAVTRLNQGDLQHFWCSKRLNHVPKFVRNLRDFSGVLARERLGVAKTCDGPRHSPYRRAASSSGAGGADGALVVSDPAWARRSRLRREATMLASVVTSSTATMVISETAVEICGTPWSWIWANSRTSLTPMNARTAARPVERNTSRAAGARAAQMRSP